MQAYTNKWITLCGDSGLPQDKEIWRPIIITGFNGKMVHGVVDGVVVDVKLDRIFRSDKLTPVKRKDLRGV